MILAKRTKHTHAERCGRTQFDSRDPHEFVVLGASDPGVGVNDGSFAHCLTSDIFLAVLILEGAIDLETPSCGRGV